MTGAGAEAMLPRPWRVRRVVRETASTFSLELVPPGGEPAPAFRPGQFNMLYLFGVGEVPMSVSGDPAHDESVVHTTRAVGAVTEAMRRLGRGAALGVRGPYGRPWPLDEATGRDVAIIAGGFGLAPLRPLVYAIAARRRDFGRVVLLYGTRSPADVLYRGELARWRARADLDVAVTVDGATRAWAGTVGVVTALIPHAAIDPGTTVAFVCGPEVMMRFTADALERRGVPAERIFVSMERNMKCAIGFCGRCQFGPSFVCRDGPVFAWSRVGTLMGLREV